jgi:hypothetical protein
MNRQNRPLPAAAAVSNQLKVRQSAAATTTTTGTPDGKKSEAHR